MKWPQVGDFGWPSGIKHASSERGLEMVHDRPKTPVTLKRWRLGLFVLPSPKAVALFLTDIASYNFMDVPVTPFE